MRCTTATLIPALVVALIVTGCLTGAGIYEQSVLDTAWPHRPSIVRPVEGGAELGQAGARDAGRRHGGRAGGPGRAGELPDGG